MTHKLKTTFKLIRSGIFLCLTLLCFSFSTPLFSFDIDLSTPEFKCIFSVLEKDADQIIFEISNVRKNTIYVLQFDDKLQNLECSHPEAILITNNSLLIENENQFTDERILITACIVFEEHDETAVEVKKIAINTDEYPNLGNEKWKAYIDEIRDIIEPREATADLIELTKDTPLKRVLTIGCEAGEDPLYFAARGIHVTALDATPHAIAITCLRMAEYDLLDELEKAIVCTLEDTSDLLGTFDAVTAGQVFSFIHPSQFNDVMGQKVLSRVAPAGYFSAHFFGNEHDWKNSPQLTFVSEESLRALFEQNGFEILSIKENKTMSQTVFNGKILWHEFQVIAKRY